MGVKIALGSDWHLGMTSLRSIEKCLRLMVAEEPDVIAMLGDMNGGYRGYRATRTIFKTIRQFFPNTPIVGCLGNHELWHMTDKRHRPSLADYMDNMRKLEEAFRMSDVWYLEEDGPFRMPQHPGYVLFGHGGWYVNPKPNTNDLNFMPIAIEGDTHRHLYKASTDKIIQYADTLGPNDLVRVFCSHFPMYRLEGERESEFSGDSKLGQFLEQEYKVDHFLEGHSHQRHEGPKKWNCGSDYYKPRYVMVNT